MVIESAPLQAALARAVRVVGTAGGSFNGVATSNEVIFDVTDTDAMTELRLALTISASEPEEVSLMTSGIVALEYFDESRRILAVVTVLGGGWIRWSGWAIRCAPLRRTSADAMARCTQAGALAAAQAS